MKIAATSASFGPPMRARERTQLEWLDACANELEADGVVFELAHFPRTDADYLAQVKKTCADLGLAIAGLDAGAVLWSEAAAASALEVALALGAPLVLARAPAASAEPAAWGAFAESAKTVARAAKERNVTIALGDGDGTLCEDGAALRRLAKDVDSAWLRFGPGSRALASDDHLLEHTVIVVHAMTDADRFARDGDEEAETLLRGLARFRGFLALSLARQPPARDAYHAALERFDRARARTLASPQR